jgi:hypothetical protein
MGGAAAGGKKRRGIERGSVDDLQGTNRLIESPVEFGRSSWPSAPAEEAWRWKAMGGDGADGKERRGILAGALDCARAEIQGTSSL